MSARGFVVLTGVILLSATACGGSVARATTQESRGAVMSESRDLASEICSPSIRRDVLGQVAGGRLRTPPALTRRASTTTCLYSFVRGSFRMQVRESKTNAAARRYFDRLERVIPGALPVPNLGTAAFVRVDGTTVTVKDHKVLTVDPTQLAPGYDRTQIAESLSFEVLTCWTG